ncbi:hypothetical protein FA13DRAFT_1808630 [Coprinellus micaceus]|uniref:RNA polymerase II subunit A C-terminal domain phosphatase n=1 Tax=Coprinellus micaceus TaxID=71717 RepID=A0A4Y7TXN4_COPMI|nr:hypothetical protein FA13DRAFT_1808630 [Coprinellus micaceus]
MADPTDLFLPTNFPYPIKVISLDAPPRSPVQRGTRLLSYSFVYHSKVPDTRPATRFGTWDSAIEGDIKKWNIKVGDTVTLQQAKARAAVVVVEPCKHGVQLGGLCALCGKDLTIIDYTGFSDASRANIQMTHSAFGPTVSLEEAQRIERETANHLLKSRKLSLIVDLDQTIVHATVDPTVGEWIAEGETWEAKQERKRNKTKSTTPVDSDDSDDESSDDDDDECNPNWGALKDVQKFRLGPESFANPLSRQKGKHKMVEADGCMYYIKPRPGWKEFLEEASKKYEMHVYTMGTRAYAEQVCAIIDPEGKIFGPRILSRDESGSLTQKSLKRLFPCDTSMVVIIDDRADVWEWSPNLVKVIPYDFFVGIGDINSTFLPKIDPSTPAPISLPSSSSETKPPPSEDVTTTSDASTSDVPVPSVVNGDESAAAETAEQTVLVLQNNAALDAQSMRKRTPNKHRPQPTIQRHLPSPTPESDKENKDHKDDHHHHRKALLKNDDVELDRVGKLLDAVHQRYFMTHDAHAKDKSRSKPTGDVTRIIPQIRAETLEGCHILFSGLIPLDTKPETTEIWRQATMFGAKCYTELHHDITHVVAAKRGTVKVDQARKRGNIFIVSQNWLTDSIAQWRRADEKPHLLEEPTAPLAPVPTSETSSVAPSAAGDAEKDMELGDVDWDAINDEVDAAMNESDDDEDSTYIGNGGDYDTRSEKSGDEATEDGSMQGESNSANSSPRLKRKRLRSLTPSEARLDHDEMLRSPLSKRKKLANDRSGMSKLKEGVTASEMGGDSNADWSKAEEPESPTAWYMKTDEGDGDEDEDEEDEGIEDDDEGGDSELDDFLARELEEEWG